MGTKRHRVTSQKAVILSLQDLFYYYPPIYTFVSHLISVPYIFQQNLIRRPTFQLPTRARYVLLADLIITSHI
jgi:hypothetical protein